MLERGGAVLAPLADHILQRNICTTQNSELCFYLPHVATENLVKRSRLLGVIINVLVHFFSRQVTFLQRLNQVSENKLIFKY